MLAATYRLTSKDDFANVKANGKNYHSTNFTVSVCHAPQNKYPRFGIVVPNKVFPLAVDRSRVKRVLWESLRFQITSLSPEFDCVFLPKPSILRAYTADVMKEVAEICEKAGMAKKKNV